MNTFNCSFSKVVPVSSLQVNPRNPNKHPKKQIDILAKIISYQGQRSPIVVSNQSGFIVKGHGRLEAIKQLGWDNVAVDYQDYKDSAQEFADMVADNKIAELAEHDDNLMIEGLKYLELTDMDFELLGMDAFEIPLEPDPAKEEIEDEIPESVDTRCKPGDLWILGQHRLLCGDSTNIQHVERLMGGEESELLFTSPPYSDMRDYNGDKDLSVDNLKDFITVFSHVAKYQVINLGLQRKNNEIFDYWTTYINTARDNGYLFLSWNVWDKMEAGSIGNQTAMFPIEHEWIFVFGKEKKILNKTIECKWAKEYSTGNSRRQKDGSLIASKNRVIGGTKPIGTVYTMPPLKARNLDNKHPAAFTVEFASGYIEAMTNKNDLVCEPFGGSGSTLIACEKTNRKCYMMELDTYYCDVILARWEKYSDKKAVLSE